MPPRGERGDALRLPGPLHLLRAAPDHRHRLAALRSPSGVAPTPSPSPPPELATPLYPSACAWPGGPVAIPAVLWTAPTTPTLPDDTGPDRGAARFPHPPPVSPPGR